uniref:Signal recognition particle 14 kDa protein n=1 Tax=Oncorhynchus mykiss TaxID=8022 RepID=A0A8C7RW22_ONCMY
MVLLENDSFLTELTRLFQKCRTTGSVAITLKKYDGRTKPVPRKGHPESYEPADNKCLLRASDGKKKISTVVSLKHHVRKIGVGGWDMQIARLANVREHWLVGPILGSMYMNV